MSATLTLSAHDERVLLAIARDAIAAALRDGRAEPPVDDLGALAPALAAPAATFVTLERDGRLLGCIGRLDPARPLAADVAAHAIAAAFDDPRLPPVSADDYAAMSIKISVLGAPEPLPARSHPQLLDGLRPGIDGLVVDAPGHRATFLPSVWRQLPDPVDFVTHLWHKAGLRVGTWPAGLRLHRYTAHELVDPGPRPPL